MKLTSKQLRSIMVKSKIDELFGQDIIERLSLEDTIEINVELTEMGITNKSGFTSLGEAISTSLELYSKSIRYCSLGANAIGANYKDNEYVFINFKNEVYNIDLLNKDQLVLLVLSQLNNYRSISILEEETVKIKSTKMIRMLEQDQELTTVLPVSSLNVEYGAVYRGLLFVKYGAFCFFNQVSEELVKFPADQVQGFIEKILKMERGDADEWIK